MYFLGTVPRQKHRQSEQQLLETRAHVLDLEGREIVTIRLRNENP